MTTLSQMVDDLVAELRRRDLRSAITAYVNQTIRELHAQPGQLGRSLTFGSNLKEAALVPVTENGHVWTIPEARNFQTLASVWYPAYGLAPKERGPGTAMEFLHEVDGSHYFYRSGDSYVFNGFGGPGTQIWVAWYSFPRRLTYIEPIDRPVVWNDLDQEYQYKDPLWNEDQKEAARLISTHWVLERWQDLIMEGARAKVFKRIGDDARARLSYSLYESMRPGFISAESYEYVGRVNR